MATPPGQMRWFGLYFTAPTSDFVLRFRARFHPQPQEEPHGFGICVRCAMNNDVPDGPAIQYDPAFHGLRLLRYPHDFDPQSYEAEPIPVDHAWHAWSLTVEDARLATTIDGLPILNTTSAVGSGTGIFLRVWNGSASLWDLDVEGLIKTSAVTSSLLLIAHKLALGRVRASLRCLVGWPGGIAPPGSHRTERGPLGSLRSSHRNPASSRVQAQWANSRGSRSITPVHHRLNLL